MEANHLPEPRPLADDDLAERITALRRTIEWRRGELLRQTLRKLDAWRDKTRTDAATRIGLLELGQQEDAAELRKLEAREHLSRMLRQAQSAAMAEGVEAGHWMATLLDGPGPVADVIPLYPRPADG